MATKHHKTKLEKELERYRKLGVKLSDKNVSKAINLRKRLDKEEVIIAEAGLTMDACLWESAIGRYMKAGKRFTNAMERKNKVIDMLQKMPLEVRTFANHHYKLE